MVVSPAFNAATGAVIAIVGLIVSIESVNVLFASLPSALVFPAASENLLLATLITPSVLLSSVGVNVAV